jgi:hypothetical protein
MKPPYSVDGCQESSALLLSGVGHQVNHRFKPGGRKKINSGLAAQGKILLFLQAKRLYRIKESYISNQNAMTGRPFHIPPAF